MFPLSICGLEDSLDLGGDNLLCPPEQTILKHFFEANNCNDWATKDYWLGEYMEPCGVVTWHGLTCNNSLQVEKITLDGNSLFGKIPTDIFT